MLEKVKCPICRDLKAWDQYPRLVRKRYGPKRGIYTDVNSQNQNKENPCKDCDSQGIVKYAVGLYNRMCYRNYRAFGRYPKITLSQFWQFAKTSDYAALYNSHTSRKNRGASKWDKPCVDRIDSWNEYELGNIQIITCSENSSKGNAPALGARRLTMRFFKKLREERGLTKYEMANFLGMLPSTYYYYEDEAKGCSFEILCLIRKKLEMSWEKLGVMIDEEFGHPDRYETSQVITRKKKSE